MHVDVGGRGTKSEMTRDWQLTAVLNLMCSVSNTDLSQLQWVCVVQLLFLSCLGLKWCRRFFHFGLKLNILDLEKRKKKKELEVGKQT